MSERRAEIVVDDDGYAGRGANSQQCQFGYLVRIFMGKNDEGDPGHIDQFHNSAAGQFLGIRAFRRAMSADASIGDSIA
jgi:hypothetical protein